MHPIQPPIPQSNPAAIVEENRLELEDAIKRVLSSGRYILGEEVEEFEKEWAQWCGASYAIGCASGTDGLELILRALDLPAGSRVLAPSHTAVATIAAIVRAGCKPFLADVNSGNFTLDPSSARRCMDAAKAEGEPIQALIAVHLYGHPCDLDEIQEICSSHKIPLIEDASQAHGAQWRGKRVGTFGTAAAFSLYPTKNLGAIGDAGVITTNEPQLTQKIKQLRQYGWKKTAISEIHGVNSRLDPLQAAILRVKLPLLEGHNLHRQAVAQVYRKIIKEEGLQLPPSASDCSEPVYHQFVVQIPAIHRDEVRTRLTDSGIGTLLHYPMAAHQMPAYRGEAVDPAGLTATEKLIPRILSLPMGTHLSLAQAAQIAERLMAVIKEQLSSH